MIRFSLLALGVLLASCEKPEPEWDVSYGAFVGTLKIANLETEFDSEDDFREKLTSAIGKSESLDSAMVSIELKTELAGLTEFVYFRASKLGTGITVVIHRYGSPRHGEERHFDDARSASGWILAQVNQLKSFKTPKNLTD